VPIGNPAVSDPAGQGLNPWEITIASLLTAQGYRTAHFGKWHLGVCKAAFPMTMASMRGGGFPAPPMRVLARVPWLQGIRVCIPSMMAGRKGEASEELEIVLP
jgi:arylsulfatase